MTRHVTVVTRNPAIAVGLTHHGYDVTDVRPDRHGDWTRQAVGTQAVVLELSDPVAADAAVRRLRADGNGTPVLVVANATPGWDEAVAHAGPGVRVLPLPITLPSLMASLEEAVEAGPVDVPPPPRNEEELLSAVARQVGLSISDAGTLVSEEPAAPVEPRDEEPVEVPVEAAAEPPAEAPVDEPALPPVEEPPLSPHVADPATEPLLAALAAAVRGFSTVAETAEAVVSDAAERLRARAALSLPDWPEGAGPEAGPRTVVATAGAETAGAARYTVAVAGGELELARDEEFGDDDRAAADALAEEWGPLLREAVAVRALARALAPYAG